MAPRMHQREERNWNRSPGSVYVAIYARDSPPRLHRGVLWLTHVVPLHSLKNLHFMVEFL